MKTPGASRRGFFFARLTRLDAPERLRKEGESMQVDRRGFTRGALALAAAGAANTAGAVRAAGVLSSRSQAMAAIQAYADAHRRWFGLPGLTLGVTSPSGFATVIRSGYANSDGRTPITPDTLFEIGSISKNFTAAMLHQFAAEGRLKLTDRIVTLLPETPLPSDSPIEVQHLLDHVAGIPGDAPLFVPGGLWTAYAPGEHWHYSNTGYDLLGHLAEHVGGKPLSAMLAERLFQPLGMRRTRGAILGEDRLLYAQGYEAADEGVPYARGTPLAPAAWVDVTTAAGCIASTAADMNLYLRSLASAAMGRGGMGLGPQQGLVYTSHSVPSDTAGMTYGNGLMHVEKQGRRYLHHTGGMVSFSSSFHVDIGNGIGAFASSTISAFANYRPRKLTNFAVEALTAAETGKKLPDPPALDEPLKNASDYAGRYSGGGRSFEIRGGQHLSIFANGREARLEPADDDAFTTLHPDFRKFTLKFDRASGKVVAAYWGPDSFAREGATAKFPPSDPALARLAGTYVNDSPWLGTAVIVERGGKLWADTNTPLTPIGDNMWRVGQENWSPERASFANFIDGRPQTLVFSGEKFVRQQV
jgi:CubicO group peptidase (beta-lactamase class C family)